MIDSILQYGVLVFLAGLYIWERRQADARMRDLLDRLMARSYSELTAGRRASGPPRTLEDMADYLATGESEAGDDVIRIQ